MLGRFLEYSVATPDIRASLEFYSSLGFSSAQVGEAWTHPYAVVTDGRICLGLHQEPDFVPSTTFVKPGLLRHADDLEGLGIEFAFRRLGNDVFNEVGWRDPSGHLIRLLEARTFSPSKRRMVDVSLCGFFLELGLPTPGVDTSKAFWERIGFVGMEEPDAVLPHVSCTSDTLTVGLYEPAHLREPTLLFEAGSLPDSIARLAQAGITPSRRLPAPLRQIDAALLTAPEGTLILLTGPGCLSG